MFSLCEPMRNVVDFISGNDESGMKGGKPIDVFVGKLAKRASSMILLRLPNLCPTHHIFRHPLHSRSCPSLPAAAMQNLMLASS